MCLIIYTTMELGNSRFDLLVKIGMRNSVHDIRTPEICIILLHSSNLFGFAAKGNFHPNKNTIGGERKVN